MIILPLEISAGEDFYLPLQYQLQVGTDFIVQDITGYALEMEVGLDPFNLTPIIRVTSAAGQIIIDGPNGKAQIYIANSVITPYLFGCWKYAIKSINVVGLVERLVGGPFTIKGWC